MSGLPKIPLDSSSDLAFLRQQLQKALSESLQTHFPHALPEDSLRTAIEAHISTFLSNTMQETIPNVTINGMDPKPSDIAKGIQVDPESYEQFDTALQAKVLAKHEELEDIITRVTTMRREVPEKIRQHMADRARAEHEAAVEKSEAELNRAMSTVDNDDDAGEINIPRLEEVKDTYDAGVKILRQMKGNVGSVSAKTQRAKEVLLDIQRQQQQQQQQHQAVA